MSQNIRAQVVLQLRDRMSRTAGKIRDKMRGLSGSSRTLRRDLNGASDGSNRLGRSLQGTTRRSAQLDRQTLKTAQSQNRLINEFRTLKTSSQSLKQRLDQTQTKMADLARAGKKTGTEFENLKRKAGSLKRELGQQAQRLETTRRKMKDVDVSTDNLASAQRGAKAAIKSTTEALSRQVRELDRVERRQKALGRLTSRRRDQRNRMAGIGAATTAAGVGGIYAGRQALRPVTSSVGQYGSFEEQMDAVASVARVKQDSQQYKDLTGLARHLGGTTSFTAQEVGEGMEFQAMAGFAPEAIKASIGDVLDLAKATKTDLGTTSDISSNILSAFGLDPSEMTRVADVLTATTTRSNVNLTMLGESMKYVAPEAKALGISLEETAAMAGLLGNSGIQGSQAGTSLRAIYQRLAAPRTAGRNALKDLNIQTKDLHGNLRPVPELLAEIGEATKDMGTADRKQIFKDLIGVEAGSAFSTLIDEQGFEVFKTLLSELGNVKGEAHRVSTEMGDNLPGDIKTLKSAVSEVALTIGEALNPALRDATQFLTGAARSVSSWLKEHPLLTKAIGFFGIAVAGLLIVGGSLLTFLGSAMLLTAGLKFGMFMLGARALSAGGAIGILGRAFGLLGKLKPLKWAMMIPKLAWRSLITPLKWAAFLPKFAWRAIITPLKWAAFLPKLAWRGLIPALKWAALLPKLSWRLLITPLKWGARLIPGIGWALLAGELLWSLLIKPMGWDKYIPSFSWSERFSILDWSTWVPEVSLSGAGRQAIQSLWDGAVQTFNEFLAWIKTIPSRTIAAIGKIDLSNMISWPTMPSWLGGGSAQSKTTAAKPAAANANTPKFNTVDAFATGGTVARTGPILVGEQGPELRYANKGQFIAHHRQLQQMAALSRAGKRAMAGTVLAASMSGAVAAEPAPPMLQQLEAHGGSNAGGGSSTGTNGGGGSGGKTTVNHNTFHMTVKFEGGLSTEDQARKLWQLMERQKNKRLTD